MGEGVMTAAIGEQGRPWLQGKALRRGRVQLGLLSRQRSHSSTPAITRNPSHTSCFPLPGVLAPSHLPVFSPTATTAPLGWKSAQRPVSWEGGKGEFKKMPF